MQRRRNKLTEGELVLNEISVKYEGPRVLGMQITSPESAFRAFVSVFNPDTIEVNEQFVIMFLNRHNRYIGHYMHTVGGRSHVHADPALIFSAAMAGLASSIMVAHNHPSGNTKPSSADVNITNRLYEVGKLVGIELMDHLIITKQNGYFSFKEENLI